MSKENKKGKQVKKALKYSRQIKYYSLKFIRLRGKPHELALGIAFGIFSGLMPIMPFQTALAVALALFFRASKITAALGTWISNPLNWYFLYSFSYRIGASVLGLPEKSGIFSSVMASVRNGEETMVVIGKMAGAGSAVVSAFLIGGVAMGFIFAIPSYFIFLKIFQTIKSWRERRGNQKIGSN